MKQPLSQIRAWRRVGRLATLSALWLCAWAPASALASPAVSLAVPSVAPAYPAQKVRFDPLRYLDGYGDVLISTYIDLYRLSEFDQYEGHVLTEERLGEVRQAWRLERERVAGLIDNFRREPRSFVMYRMERDMLVHPYFSRVRTKTFETHDPFVFYLQSPRTSREGYEEQVIEAFGDVLLRVHKLFESEFKKPLELEAREGFAAYPIIVLAESAEYDRYLRTLDGPALFFAQAHYDPALRAVVTYLNPDQSPNDSAVLRPAVHEAVHLMRDAHAATEDRRPEPWLDEGLASYLSSHAVSAASDAASPADALAVKAMLEVAFDAEKRAGCLLGAEELAGMRTYGQAYERMGRKAVAEGVGTPDYPTALLALFGQAGTWAWYLNEENDGAYREGYRAYVKASLADKGGVEAVRRAFKGVASVEELNAGYQAFLEDSGDRWQSSNKPARDELEASFRLSDTTETSLKREVEERVNTLEALAPDRAKPEIRLASALRQARQGRFAAAAQEVQLILAYRDEGKFAERCKRELERLNGFRTQRRDFLEVLRESGKKISLMIGDKRLLASILAVEETRVLLGKNKLGLDEMALDEIDPIVLVKMMRTKRNGFDKHWLQAYPHVLLETEDWERLLEGDSEEGALQLAADANSGELANWLRLSDAVELLGAMSVGGLPEKEGQAREVLASIATLQTDLVDLPIVRDRRKAIIQIAHRSQSLLFDSDGLPAVLNAQYEDLGSGQSRLTYAFDSPAEAEDFEATNYLDDQRWKGSPSSEESIEFHVVDGVLTATGAACSRHALEFEGPQTIRLRYLFRTPEGPFDGTLRAVVGLCDDRSFSYITVDQMGGITVTDREKRYMEQVNADSQFFMDTEHELEIIHDGGDQVTTTFDGQPAAQASCGPRLNGGIFLWLNAQCPFEILEFSIEGRVTPASLRLLRTGWVEAKLAEIGLK